MADFRNFKLGFEYETLPQDEPDDREVVTVIFIVGFDLSSSTTKTVKNSIIPAANSILKDYFEQPQENGVQFVYIPKDSHYRSTIVWDETPLKSIENEDYLGIKTLKPMKDTNNKLSKRFLCSLEDMDCDVGDEK